MKTSDSINSTVADTYRNLQENYSRPMSLGATDSPGRAQHLATQDAHFASKDAEDAGHSMAVAGDDLAGHKRAFNHANNAAQAHANASKHYKKKGEAASAEYHTIRSKQHKELAKFHADWYEKHNKAKLTKAKTG
jgi:hypothetical protein